MICYRGRGAVYGELWYDEDAELPRAAVDIILYRQRKAPVPGAHSTPLLSLVIDLTVPAPAIVEQFGKDCRYKIRRADTKDGLRMEFISQPGPRLDEFCDFYDAFAGQKSVGPANRQWLEAACSAGRLLLTSVLRGSEVIVWHAYLVTGTSAWLQYSGSCYRDKANEYRALVGRANRWLHWQEMLRFKEIGMTRYDWGGLFENESSPEHAGINRFKKEFGGRPVRSYDCVLPVTLRGRLWLPLRGAWRSRTSLRNLFTRTLSQEH
ncbi:MAG: GNAT family N-acetyltransferase [Betaproteobacteria bacterium]